MQTSLSTWGGLMARTLWQERPSASQLCKLFCIIIFCFILGYATFYASRQLPMDALQHNVTEAYKDGHFALNYPQATAIIRANRTDMFTECYAIGLALQEYKDVSDLFLNKTYNECQYLSQAVEANFSEPPAATYYRYIHGSNAFVRLFYTYFDMQTARTLCSIITCLLLFILAVSLKIRVSTAHASLVIGSFLLTSSPNMYILITHATQFWLAILAAIGATLLQNRQHFFLFMGTVGALDGFFTFLSMGSLSLSIPLLCFLLVCWAQSSWEDESSPEVSILAQGFWASAAWALGFLLPWLFKWAILIFIYEIPLNVTFEDKIDIYKNSGIFMIFLALGKNFFMTHMEIWIPLFALLFWIRRKEERTMPKGLWITGFAALIPVVWCCLLPGQAGIKHSTFMNLIVWPMLCFACFYLFTPEKKASFKDLLPLNLRKL